VTVMKIHFFKHFSWLLKASFLLTFSLLPDRAFAAEKLVGLYSAQVMSMSLPWIAQEAGLFPKHSGRQIRVIGDRPVIVQALATGTIDGAF